MKTLLTPLTILMAVLMLSGCAYLKTNARDIAGGAAAVASAPVIQKAIAVCVAGDAQALQALKAPSEFFSVGYNVITDKGADVPVLTLVEESPVYYAEIPDQWSVIWSAIGDRDCGPVVAQWRVNSERAFDLVEDIVAKRDRLAKACGLYNAYAPVAALFTATPLPTRVPGCPSIIQATPASTDAPA